MALGRAVKKSWFGVIRTRMKSVRHFGVWARWGLHAPPVTIALVRGSKDLRPEERAALGWGLRPWAGWRLSIRGVRGRQVWECTGRRSRMLERLWSFQSQDKLSSLEARGGRKIRWEPDTKMGLEESMVGDFKGYLGVGNMTLSVRQAWVTRWLCCALAG